MLGKICQVATSLLLCCDASRLAPPLMRMPAVGTALPLPATLGSLEALPARFDTLEALANGRELLVLVAAAEGAMTDPLRQTLNHSLDTTVVLPQKDKLPAEQWEVSGEMQLNEPHE